MSPQTLLQRLESLQKHLNKEGWHVHSNTVWLAMEELSKRGRGRPPTGFNKKQYDRDRMKRLRAEAKTNPPPSKPQKDRADE